MNYEVGLLVFLLFYVPVYLIWWDLKRKDKEIEKRYNKALDDINQNYK